MLFNRIVNIQDPDLWLDRGEKVPYQYLSQKFTEFLVGVSCTQQQWDDLSADSQEKMRKDFKKIKFMQDKKVVHGLEEAWQSAMAKEFKIDYMHDQELVLAATANFKDKMVEIHKIYLLYKKYCPAKPYVPRYTRTKTNKENESSAPHESPLQLEEKVRQSELAKEEYDQDSYGLIALYTLPGYLLSDRYRAHRDYVTQFADLNDISLPQWSYRAYRLKKNMEHNKNYYFFTSFSRSGLHDYGASLEAETFNERKHDRSKRFSSIRLFSQYDQCLGELNFKTVDVLHESIFYAVQYSNLGAVKWLIDYARKSKKLSEIWGVFPETEDIKNYQGLNLIQWASVQTECEVLDYLLNVRKELAPQSEKDLANSFHGNLLHLAASKGKVLVAAYLIKYFPHFINQVDYLREVPLHKAIRCQNVKITAYLLKASAHQIKNKNGQDPFSVIPLEEWTEEFLTFVFMRPFDSLKQAVIANLIKITQKLAVAYPAFNEHAIEAIIKFMHECSVKSHVSNVSHEKKESGEDATRFIVSHEKKESGEDATTIIKLAIKENPQKMGKLLMHVCKEGICPELISILINENPELINMEDDFGNTPLLTCIRSALAKPSPVYLAIVDALLENSELDIEKMDYVYQESALYLLNKTIQHGKNIFEEQYYSFAQTLYNKLNNFKVRQAIYTHSIHHHQNLM